MSPWGTPTLFVQNKDDTLRLCVDFKQITNTTIKNRYSLSRIDDLFDELTETKIFYKIDLRPRYHQVRIKDEDIKKIVFRTRYSHYEYTVLPFGLTSSPATFMYLMTGVFK